MTDIGVFDLIGRRALIARGSAKNLGSAIETTLEKRPDRVIVDFDGVDAVTPSFVDEMVFVFENAVSDSGMEDVTFLLRNIPTRLSSKFAAIGRARKVTIVEAEPGVWEISRREVTPER